MAWKVYTVTGERKMVQPAVDTATLSGIIALINGGLGSDLSAASGFLQVGGGAVSAQSYPVPVVKGGTGANNASSAMDNISPTTTKGDLIADNGSVPVRLGVGTDGQYLQADSAASQGVSYRDLYDDAELFGDGADGNVTINTGVQLTRDMYYNNLTIGSSAFFDTKGFRVFVRGILDISGATAAGWLWQRGKQDAINNTTYSSPGQNANATMGEGVNAGMTSAGTVGANGPNQATPGDLGGIGGVGGANNNSGFLGGTVQNWPQIRRWPLDKFFLKIRSAGLPLTGGSCGSQGGSGNISSGGLGGAGGTVLYIAARTINRSTGTAVALLSGGNGATGIAGNANGGGGGGGGGGGYVFLIYRFLTGTQKVGLFDLSGGSGGQGTTGFTTGGTGGQGGSAGGYAFFNAQTGTATIVNPSGTTQGAAGSLNSGVTGGAGGAGQQLLVTL